ncbi:hypothetical protein TWF225_004926 [Orbilia oligospora]|uniref:Uncharacterized protein n=1 Tax=Orbilia oligospora TaxID=2813651 RepID=A0A7C8TVV7_ORBOL|nr:hypothetical protein TWF751_006059 [Orbilia oligospora]KAF3185952.1 hypothetical protein TWF225_004926 [Orbilia oligospora]KAF3263108.1 hypothetical protein TWF128_002064 [Orbilia oligospora]KAF3267474.1 hypothetical protein TWF217_000526 [Orbilia oligospora]KAF3294494.1 hypothetical protein TWF132_003466 [Orbilia oligospora]
MSLPSRIGKSLNWINPSGIATDPSAQQYKHLATGASATLLSTFPQELIDEILFNISKKDIFQLSSCSKYWRARTIPLIFHHLAWKDVNDAYLFSHGGILAYVRPVVRQISMSFTHPPKAIIKIIETYRVWMEVFSLFPNVRDLQMDLYVVNELEGNMIRSILTQISNSPAAEKLQSLNIERISIERGFIHDLTRPHGSILVSTLGIYTNLPLGAREYYEILPRETRDFLGPLINNETDISLPVPKGLTKLGVSLKEFSLVSNPHSSLDFNVLVHSLAGSIKELRIMADRFIHTQDPASSINAWPTTFSALATITIIVDGYSLHHLTDIGIWIPNIQFLTLSNGPSYPYRHRNPNILALLSAQEQMLCKAIEHLKSLKRIRLPWPYTYEDQFNIGIDSLNHWPKVYFNSERLNSLVGKWVKSGSSTLERVVFIIEYFSSNGRHDKILRVNVLRGPEFEEGWNLCCQEDHNYIYKPFDRDISV